MTFIYYLLLVCFCLVFVYSIFRSIDDKNTTRGEDLFRAVIMVLLIVAMYKFWR